MTKVKNSSDQSRIPEHFLSRERRKDIMEVIRDPDSGPGKTVGQALPDKINYSEEPRMNTDKRG
ncbi:MAG TPA: hypothetical protein DIW81_27025 [Planctomycetaceae bacterium]|nr:hypothetical protein [Rubinisphaera sp.]HCS55195.1 hypothetical protein [Planctomycetaceae bacterium]